MYGASFLIQCNDSTKSYNNNNFKVMVGGIGEGNILLHVVYEEEMPVGLYNRGYESMNVNTKWTHCIYRLIG